MNDSPRSYRFGPATVSGAFGSPLSWLQAASLGAGLYAAWRVFSSSGGAGVPVAVAMALATCGATFMPIRGREPVEWLPIALFTITRRLLGKHKTISQAPTAGFRGDPADPSGPGEPPQASLPNSLRHIEIIGATFDRHTVGVIKDKQARTYAAVLKVRV